MAQQTINVGTAPNDGTGDTLKTSFTKCNANFTELYGAAWRTNQNFFDILNVRNVAGGDGVSLRGLANQGWVYADGASADISLVLSSKGNAAITFYNAAFSRLCAQFTSAPGSNTFPTFTGNVGFSGLANNPAGNPIVMGSDLQLTSGSTAVTQAASDSSTKIATTAFAKAGQRVLITSQTISTPVAFVAFTTGIDGTYDEYEIDFFNVGPASGEAQLNANISIDGGATWKTDALYQIAGFLVGATGAPAWIQATGLTVFVAAFQEISGATIGKQSGIIRFYKPATSEFHMFMIDSINHASSVSFSRYGGVAAHASTVPFNGIKFSVNGGANVNSGTFNLYGIKK